MKEKEFEIDKYIENSVFMKTLFKENGVLIEKIDDGMLNNIFKISSNENSVVIKQFPQYLVRGEKKIPLPLNRPNIEYNSLVKFKENTPRHIPKPLYLDEENSLVVLQYLEDYIPLEYIIKEFRAFDEILLPLGDTIACNLVNNSLSKSEAFIEFENKKMKDYIKETLFVIDSLVLENNQKIKNNLQELEYKFINKNETLLHGNLKNDSIMVKKSNFFLIDFESSILGPYGFELAPLIQCFIMDYVFCKNVIKNHEYARYLLISLSKIIEKFEKSFCYYYEQKFNKKPEITELINDSFAYASLHMLQKIINIRIIHKQEFQNNEQTQLLEFTKHIKKISLIVLENFKSINKIEDLLVVL